MNKNINKTLSYGWLMYLKGYGIGRKNCVILKEERDNLFEDFLEELPFEYINIQRKDLEK